MSKIISVQNLIYEYERMDVETGRVSVERAVDDVSFDLERGSFVAIVGHNGSGKSTLARNLNGLLTPTSGRVLVDGMDTADAGKIWDIRSRVGMVFQNPDNQIVSSIVEDDVAFGPENLGVEPAEIRRRVDAALAEVGMYEVRMKGPHQLSGGQKQRIAIAGAIAMKPECIVFDEPTAMLDPKGRDTVLKIIRQLNEEGITAILITHYMEEAAEADRIIVMKGGKVYSDSTPAELFNNRELIEGAGLEMPPAVDLRERVAKLGCEMPTGIVTDEELIEYILAFAGK